MELLIRTRPKRPIPKPTDDPIVVRWPEIRLQTRPRRILDFDIEARPLHWISGDYVSREITAIAWQWIGEESEPHCYLLGVHEPEHMLSAFVDAYDQADLVTGHFIRGYDLPNLNGALTEYHMPPLSDKWAHDTKLDLVKRAGLSSSQENLGAMLGLTHPKVKMDQTKWRRANRLTHQGIEEARTRVIGDVLQHIEMRQKLLDLGYLNPPRIWRSANSRLPEYTP